MSKPASQRASQAASGAPTRRGIGRGPLLTPTASDAHAIEEPGALTFVEGEIADVLPRPLRVHHDGRGWLVEVFRHDELGQDLWPTMAYVSMTLPGVTRGPHEHADQTDGFAFIGPSDFRVWAWDIRPDSPTCGHRATWVLGQSHPAALWIPPGVVHAYKNIGPVPGLVLNAPNRLYAGWGKSEPVDEIRHEDAAPGRFVMED